VYYGLFLISKWAEKAAIKLNLNVEIISKKKKEEREELCCLSIKIQLKANL